MITQPELYDPLIDSYLVMLDGNVSGDNLDAGGGFGPALQAQTFPFQLYQLLEDAGKQGFDHIISWQYGGRSFKIHQPEYFARNIMQRYFAQTKFKSFQRQMNVYDWKKVHHGPNKGGYVHTYFIRGHPDLCCKIVRRSASKVDMEDLSDNSVDRQVSRGREESMGETNDMGPLLDHIIHTAHQVPQRRNFSISDEFDMDFIIAAFEPPLEKMAECYEERSQPLPHKALLQNIKSPSPGLDHRLDDDIEGVIDMLNQDTSLKEAAERLSFQSILRKDNTLAESTHIDLEEEDSLHLDHSFPFKLHLMLENAKKDGFDHIVSWCNNGTAFKVLKCKEFVDNVMPLYFDQSKYESFRRQLNLYGFSRVTRGEDRGIVSHPNFLQADRNLCKKITRKQQTKSGSAKAVVSQPHSHTTGASSTTLNQEVIL